MKKRPRYHGSTVTTPHAATMVGFLGGITHKDLVISGSEKRALDKLYGMVQEKPRQRPPRPVFTPPDPKAPYWEQDKAKRMHEQAVKSWENWKDPIQFFQDGADRNMLRHAEADGMRLITWLARFVPPGEDPLRHLIQAVAEAGWDVEPEDFGWAVNGDEEDEPEARDDQEPHAEDPDPSTALVPPAPAKRQRRKTA